MASKSINDYLNSEVKEYAKYVLYSRAIPNIIDGLKPGQRKILFTALKVAKNKKVKTASLSGQTMALANFHHGDASLSSASTLMAGEWNNNAPLLEGEGNFGSRLINEAGAPRYTFVKLHENFNKWFKDSDILLPQPDPEDPEPLFYLPIIPWVLVNGVSGIATGFATKIFPRNPKDLAKCTIQAIQGKKVKEPIPHFPEFKGTVEPLEIEGKYLLSGVIQRQSSTKVNITEIPYGMDRLAYLKILDKLLDSRHIVRYTENCGKHGFEFTVVLPNKHKDKSDDEVLRLLKLTKQISENITVIDETGTLIQFERASDLIKHFVKVRLGFYQLRFENLIRIANEDLKWFEAKRAFIEKFVEGVYTVKDKTRMQMLAYAKEISVEHSDRLLGIPIYRFNTEEIDNSSDKIDELNKDIDNWKNVNIQTEFMKEVKNA